MITSDFGLMVTSLSGQIEKQVVIMVETLATI